MSYLNFLLETAEQEIETIVFITVIAVALIVIVVGILSAKKLFSDTRQIVNAAISIAAAFALSFIRFGVPFIYGGSITLASFVPLIIYSYVYGFKKGLIVGIIYGALQFLQESWFLNPIQLLLDFPLAFASISLAGIFKNAVKNSTAALVLGVVAVGLFRLIMHTLSGIYFFEAGWIAKGLPAENALIYSILYNSPYVALDIAISLAVLLYMKFSGSLDRLKNVMIGNR